ncbi:PilZ domain-containing protein [Sphingomonas aurantiaca]|uniref:PilZ domain-containing protein n=1 Tax=Sphingomonas aurantiaca TaxID=185949 RepID=UPI002FE3770F
MPRLTYFSKMFSAEFEPVEANRRRAARSRVALNAELDGSHRTLCKVANISIGGIRLRTYSALKVGAKIWITIPIIGRVSATVKWADDYNAGCEFAEPIRADVIETLLSRAGRGDAFPSSRSGK